MIGNPKISVIIPCFNYGEFLEDAVDSVLSQTFKDFEIIIVNDGSTDAHTLDVLEKIHKEHPEITIVHQENGHLANARNNGVRIAKGEFFLPLDADDRVHSTMLQKCYDLICKDERLGFVYTKIQLFGDVNEAWESQEYDFDALLDGNYIVATSLIRKKCWEEIGGYDESMKGGYEDWEFYIRLGIAKWYGKLIKEKLFYYRKHGVSMIDGAVEKHALNVQFIEDKYPDVYAQHQQRMIRKDNEKLMAQKKYESTFYARMKAWRPRYLKKSIAKFIQYMKWM